jgi:molecular chaperone GrpE
MGKEHRIPVNRTSNDAQTQNLTTSSETEHEPDREAQAGAEEVGEKVEAQEDADPIRKLQDQLKSKEDEAKQSYDRLLRVSAEFENYKKRAAREMDDFRKYANQSLLREFLTVVDNLELAKRSAESEREIDQRLVEGLDITLKEIHRIFERFDVKTIEAVGKPFDPTYHEAVMRQETEDHPENTVVDEYQKGYLLRDRLLRPAMVVVAVPKVANNQVNEPPDKES